MCSVIVQFMTWCTQRLICAVWQRRYAVHLSATASQRFQIATHQLKLNMHQNSVFGRGSVCPGPRWGSLQCSPDLLVNWGEKCPFLSPLDAFCVSIVGFLTPQFSALHGPRLTSTAIFFCKLSTGCSCMYVIVPCCLMWTVHWTVS